MRNCGEVLKWIQVHAKIKLFEKLKTLFVPQDFSLGRKLEAKRKILENARRIYAVNGSNAFSRGRGAVVPSSGFRKEFHGVNKY